MWKQDSVPVPRNLENFSIGSKKMPTIKWQTSLRTAQGDAQTTRKPLLLDFFNPE